MTRRGCRCRGMFTRDISPWCEVHATSENLTEDERLEAIKQLAATISFAQRRINELENIKVTTQ